VIEDVDATLEALIRTAIPSSACLVDFRAPSPEWSDALSQPCCNLFLHDLVEEATGRGADWVDVRDERGRVTVRQPPLRTFRLSYVVSVRLPAQGSGAEDRREHALLGKVLQVFVEADPIPSAVLRGALVEEAGLVSLSVAEPYEKRMRPYELWSSLGVPTRASFDLVVNAPLRTSVTVEAAAAVESISLSTTQERPTHQRHGVAPSGALPPAGSPATGSAIGCDKRWTSFRIREE
jgi:hypothetical protein